MAVAASAAPRILIVRRDNIGDLVCTTPLLSALRAQLPQAWIGVLATTYNAEVLARNPSVHEVFVHEKLKHRRGALLAFVRARLGLAGRLRAQNLDVVLVPAPSPQALKAARALRPGRVIASPARFPEGQHEVERTYDLGRSLGLRGHPGPMRIFPEPECAARLRAALEAGPCLAIHISARRRAQQWPPERYAALARELAREATVMLLWAPGPRDDPRHPGDDAAAARVVEETKGSNVMAVPTPDLTTLVAALSLADKVVCPDGGAMHIAAALGKPVVALFGDSPVSRWRPWAVPHRVVSPGSRNLADLALEPVLEAFKEMGSE
jgi:ADP-heptose:LPS heptosyltransferase